MSAALLFSGLIQRVEVTPFLSVICVGIRFSLSCCENSALSLSTLLIS